MNPANLTGEQARAPGDFGGSLYTSTGIWLHDQILANLAPSEWISRGAKKFLRLREPENAVEVYIILVTLALGALWWWAPVLVGLGVAVAALRWLEIASTGFGLVLKRPAVKAGKNLLTVGIYGIQMPLIFAIFGRALTSHIADWSGPVPATRGDFLYMSWTNILTLGNNFVPHSGTARAIVAASGSSGVLLLAIFVAYAVGQFSHDPQRHEPPRGQESKHPGYASRPSGRQHQIHPFARTRAATRTSQGRRHRRPASGGRTD